MLKLGDDHHPVLEVKHLTKRYGSLLAVDNLTLTIHPGEVLGLLGPNGAGKTTAIRSILGLVKPDVGEVWILGCSVAQQRQKALQHVGAIVEGPTAYGYLSGRDNLRLSALLSGNRVEGNIDHMLRSVGLIRAAHMRTDQYSLGMKQRLSLAQALLAKPRLLVLDEPFNGLDPRGIRELRTLILRLAHEEGLAILLSSHLLHEVEQVCDHVTIIDKGKEILTGSVKELLERRTGVLEDLFIELTGDEENDPVSSSRAF